MKRNNAVELNNFSVERDRNYKEYVINKVQPETNFISEELSLNDEEIVLEVNKIKGYLNGLSISSEEFIYKFESGLCSGMTKNQIVMYAAEVAESMHTKHPDYGKLSAFIVIRNLHEITFSKFSEMIEYAYKNSRLISESFYNDVMANKDILDFISIHERDYDHTYFAIMTLIKSYLLSINNKVIETPQHMFLRTAVQIYGRDINSIKATYDLLSKKFFSFGSPGFFNSGSEIPQFGSCFLTHTENDTVESHFDSFKKCAMISKNGGGIGINFHDVRAKGSKLNKIGGHAKGIVPLAQMYNWSLKYIGHSNKRTGRIAIYLEPWHKDIFSFLDLRKNTGKEEVRARDVFTALWVSDLFMKRVESDSEWSLFCPSDVPGLSDMWGEEFEKAYVEYERKVTRVVVPAQKLWRAIIEAQIETGTPYMLYKDTCNRLSNQQNLGIIKSSNLCAEIVEYIGKDEIAVCNLASICLPKFIVNGQFDFNLFRTVVNSVVKFMNKIIDINHYPVEEAKRSNLRHRPIGIGVQGLADTFMSLGYPFESNQARTLNKDIFETLYYSAVESSCEIAATDGRYCSYEGSPLSKGIFHWELAGAKVSDRWDWNNLRNNIFKYGTRNSLFVAVMPTASTSQICNNSECVEPYTSNLFTRRTFAGEFKVLNKFLMKDLINAGLWSEQLKDLIIEYDGSIQEIPLIPQEIKELYKTAWEIKMKKLIDLASDRQPFIDQSQSLNIFIAQPTYSQVSSMHFYGFKKGLKTGMYYLRTKPISSAIKFTIDPSSISSTLDKMREKEDECEGCSA